MRFRKKKTTHRNNRTDRQLTRKRLWKDPSIIEELFADSEWQSHERDRNQITPSVKMAQHIREEISKETKQQKYNVKIKPRITQFIYYAAASVLLLLSIGFWFWIKLDSIDNAPKVIVQQVNAEIKQDTTWISLTNAKKSVMIHTLPDSSTVKLFTQSTLRYAQGFSDQQREIYLDGKAFFLVKKDASRPFSVYAGGAKTTALGTSFTINTRSNAKYTSVKLHTGKVIVAATTAQSEFESIILNKSGELVSFDANMKIINHKKGKIKKSATAVVKPNKINKNHSVVQLNNIPIAEVFVTLHSTYDILVKIGDDEISKIHYTGSIDPQRETIQDVLNVICLINNLRYIHESDGSFTIYLVNENDDSRQTNL